MNQGELRVLSVVASRGNDAHIVSRQTGALQMCAKTASDATGAAGGQQPHAKTQFHYSHVAAHCCTPAA